MSFVEWRRSELALSEVEGVNPEQAPAFMPASRRVDKKNERITQSTLNRIEERAIIRGTLEIKEGLKLKDI
jgi:hypothetical protein